MRWARLGLTPARDGSLVADREIVVKQHQKQQDRYLEQQNTLCCTLTRLLLLCQLSNYRPCKASPGQVLHNLTVARALLLCRNINLIKQPEPDQDGPSSSSGGGSTVSSLQLQLLTVARVHEAMAEGLAGGAAQEQGEAWGCCSGSASHVPCLIVGQ